jgi:hypothetical protein
MARSVKGHVPAEHLTRYRWLTRARWQASMLQPTLAGIGETDLALSMRDAANALAAAASDLRVDLPERRESDVRESHDR